MKRSSTPKERKKWTRLAVIVAMISGLVLVLSGVGSALDEDELANDVLEAVLLDQDVDLDDGPVRDRLRDQVRDAIRIGAVPGEILDEVGDRLRERINEQVRIWAVIAPEWREAFEQLRDRVRDCRDSDDMECWRELRLQLQYEHAKRFEEMYENRYQEMQSNGESASELGELERLREQTRERVEDMIRNGTADSLSDAGLQQQELEQLQERLR